MRRVKPFYIFLAGLFLMVYTAFYLNIPLTPQTRILPQLPTSHAIIMFCISVPMVAIGIIRMILLNRFGRKK